MESLREWFKFSTCYFIVVVLIVESTDARCQLSDKLTELSGLDTSSASSVLNIPDVFSAPLESELGRKRKTKVNPPHGK